MKKLRPQDMTFLAPCLVVSRNDWNLWFLIISVLVVYIWIVLCITTTITIGSYLPAKNYMYTKFRRRKLYLLSSITKWNFIPVFTDFSKDTVFSWLSSFSINCYFPPILMFQQTCPYECQGSVFSISSIEKHHSGEIMENDWFHSPTYF